MIEYIIEIILYIICYLFLVYFGYKLAIRPEEKELEKEKQIQCCDNCKLQGKFGCGINYDDKEDRERFTHEREIANWCEIYK